MTVIDTPNGFASFVRPDMREEAVLIAEQIRMGTKRIRNEIERAHALNAEAAAYVELRSRASRRRASPGSTPSTAPSTSCPL